MNGWLWLAIALLGGLGLFHSVLGEKYILIRLFRREDLPKLFGTDDFTKRTLRFAWHLTTVAYWGLAACVWLLAEGHAVRTTVVAIAGTLFSSIRGSMASALADPDMPTMAKMRSTSISFFAPWNDREGT